MNKFLCRVISIVACVLVAPVASATVLNFDDLIGGPTFFTQNYQGFKFGDNSLATNPWFYTDQVSPFYVPHSGTHYIATDFTLYSNGLNDPTQPITNTTPFVFNGAWFSGGDPVHYELYSGSTLVFTSASTATLLGVSSFVASGYAGLVTGVVIVGHQGYYALDDFTFNVAAPAAVPEPETLSLLALGIVGIGLASRRRRR